MQAKHPKHPIRRRLIAANLMAPVAVVFTDFHLAAIAASCVIHSLLTYALIHPLCDWLCPVATRFRTSKKEVWLTLDDGPDGAGTEELLGILERYRAKATFFVKGERLANQAGVLQKLLEAGHGLGNHTQSHPVAFFWAYSPRLAREEIDRCNQAIQRACGIRARYFRSPVGIKNLFLYPALLERGMRFVGWSVRGKDGLKCEPDAVVERVKSLAKPGAIILLHEGRHDGNGNSISNRCIARVLEELARMGYSFVIPGEEELI